MEHLLLGIGIGFIFGAYLLRWLSAKEVSSLRKQRDRANAQAGSQCVRAMELHRRAQRAEGRLQRIVAISGEDWAMGGNSSRYVTTPWSPHPLCREVIRGGHEPDVEDLTEAICFDRIVRQRDEAERSHIQALAMILFIGMCAGDRLRRAGL